ncbi:hypothetical protein RM530_08520 [Algiphilus sp. W345]|uniref:Uncharacterized protein n=1 Tax=Banduia mediterranea TaxID=3075609 RepID=A0ABU2WHQ4_9GAMM|nr:hypothetical protein [Algiphilus sp. W345]MDT0497408.1 hypothetical protein [Algiphilus sp. W345]
MFGILARGMKDGALAMSLKAFVNDRFRAYGEVLDCTADTKSGKLTLHAMLKGEKEPVTATIERYELESEGTERYIVPKSFSSSRAWLTTLLNQFVANKRFKLPGTVSKFL